MNKLKLYISYFFIILTISIYVISSSYYYQQEIYLSEIEDEIEVLKEENDELTVEINMKNSRENVMEDYPELGFKNNVEFLEEIDE